MAGVKPWQIVVIAVGIAALAVIIVLGIRARQGASTAKEVPQIFQGGGVPPVMTGQEGKPTGPVTPPGASYGSPPGGQPMGGSGGGQPSGQTGGYQMPQGPPQPSGSKSGQ